MHKPEIWRLVINQLAPHKPDATSSDWRSYVYRYLVPEVHQETLRFYGSTDSIEALHPGLDYANPAHRLRLSAFPRHQQLFAVFDNLRLSPSEIYSLCKWDGTKRERESYERRTNTKVADTTWEGVHPHSHKPPTSVVLPAPNSTSDFFGATSSSVLPNPITPQQAASPDNKPVGDVEIAEGSSEESEDDDVQQSVGLSLNRHLIAATEARTRGEDVSLDSDWEQWMKEALERGILPEQTPASLHQPRQQLQAPSETEPTWYRLLQNHARNSQPRPSTHLARASPLQPLQSQPRPSIPQPPMASSTPSGTSSSSHGYWVSGGTNASNPFVAMAESARREEEEAERQNTDSVAEGVASTTNSDIDVDMVAAETIRGLRASGVPRSRPADGSVTGPAMTGMLGSATNSSGGERSALPRPVPFY